MMATHSTLNCIQHKDVHECPDVLVVWTGNGLPGLPVRDGGNSFVVINHCPWCGEHMENNSGQKE